MVCEYELSVQRLLLISQEPRQMQAGRVPWHHPAWPGWRLQSVWRDGGPGGQWQYTQHTAPGARTYLAVFRSISNMKTSIIFPPASLFCWKCLKFWSWACGGPGQSGAGGRSQPGRAPWLGQARAQLRSPTNSVRNRAVNFCTHKYLPWYKQKYLAELTVLTIFCDCDVN